LASLNHFTVPVSAIVVFPFSIFWIVLRRVAAGERGDAGWRYRLSKLV